MITLKHLLLKITLDFAVALGFVNMTGNVLTEAWEYAIIGLAVAIGDFLIWCIIKLAKYLKKNLHKFLQKVKKHTPDVIDDMIDKLEDKIDDFIDDTEQYAKQKVKEKKPKKKG